MKAVQVDIEVSGETQPIGSFGMPWICRDVNGVYHCVYNKWFAVDPDWRVMHAYSDDGGDTWDLEEVATNPSPYTGWVMDPGVCTDIAGQVFVPYEEKETAAATTHYLRCAFWNGAVWNTETATSWVSTSGSAYARPVVVMDDVENVHVIFQEVVAAGTEIHHILRRFGSWYGETTICSIAGATPYISASVDGSGHLHLFYRDVVDTTYVLLHREWDGSWSAPETVVSSDALLYLEDFVADADDNLHLYYVERIGAVATHYYKEKTPAGGWQASESVFSDSAAPYNTALLTLSKLQVPAMPEWEYVAELDEHLRMWKEIAGSWESSPWQDIPASFQLSWLSLASGKHHLFPDSVSGYPGLADENGTEFLVEGYTTENYNYSIFFISAVFSFAPVGGAGHGSLAHRLIRGEI